MADDGRSVQTAEAYEEEQMASASRKVAWDEGMGAPFTQARGLAARELRQAPGGGVLVLAEPADSESSSPRPCRHRCGNR